MPLEGANVVVVDWGDKRSLRTGADGRFAFDDLPIDRCRMDVYKEGWFFAGTIPALDILSTPRPADGDGDGTPACDRGALELQP